MPWASLQVAGVIVALFVMIALTVVVMMVVAYRGQAEVMLVRRLGGMLGAVNDTGG
jgi:hypothetical protein